MSLVRANLFILHRKLFQTVALGIKSAKEMFLTPTMPKVQIVTAVVQPQWEYVDMKHQSCSLPACWASAVSKCCQVCLQRVNATLCVDVPHKAGYAPIISCGRNTVVHLILQYLLDLSWKLIEKVNEGCSLLLFTFWLVIIQLIYIMFGR